MVWSVGDVQGLEHEDVDPPEVPDPGELPTRAELEPDQGRPVMPFWDNFDQRLVERSLQWPPDGASAAHLADLGAEPCPPRPSTTRGSMRRARSSFSTWGAGRRGRGRTCISTRRSSPEPGPLRLVPVPRSDVGVAAARRALAGGAGRPAVVDRPGVVPGAPARRQRRRPGGVPARVGESSAVGARESGPTVGGVLQNYKRHC